MVVRISRILPAVVMLVLLADARLALCEGWSLPNPFSSESTPDAKKKTAFKTTKEPSAWEKASTGTKNFFSKTGETLGLKKREAKKTLYANPAPRVVQPPAKKQESKSWLDSLFKPEEPKKPKNVGEWMENNKRMDP
jgi:hypothetical protein